MLERLVGGLFSGAIVGYFIGWLLGELAGPAITTLVPAVGGNLPAWCALIGAVLAALVNVFKKEDKSDNGG